MEGLKDRVTGEQIDRRAEGMREGQKDERAEEGKDRWGGEKSDGFTHSAKEEKQKDSKEKGNRGRGREDSQV